jgi:hypothetical protein
VLSAPASARHDEEEDMASAHIPSFPQRNHPATSRRDVAAAWAVVALFLAAGLIGTVLDRMATLDIG